MAENRVCGCLFFVFPFFASTFLVQSSAVHCRGLSNFCTDCKKDESLFNLQFLDGHLWLFRSAYRNSQIISILTCFSTLARSSSNSTPKLRHRQPVQPGTDLTLLYASSHSNWWLGVGHVRSQHLISSHPYISLYCRPCDVIDRRRISVKTFRTASRHGRNPKCIGAILSLSVQPFLSPISRWNARASKMGRAEGNAMQIEVWLRCIKELTDPN